MAVSEGNNSHSGHFYALVEATEHLAALLGPLIGGHLSSMRTRSPLLLPVCWMTSLYLLMLVIVWWGYDSHVTCHVPGFVAAADEENEAGGAVHKHHAKLN
jgi:hypothetical protein